MKAWKKTRGLEQFGKPYIIWHYKTVNRFVVKIFTWLLSAFVAGILAALLCHHLNLVEIGQFLARIVFLVVFFVGVIDAYLENVFYGIDYRVADKAMLHIKPFFLLQPVLGLLGNKIASLARRIEYIEWKDIEKYKADNEKQALELQLKKSQTVQVGVAPLKRFRLPLSNEEFQPKGSDSKGDEKFFKQAMNHILNQIRKAKSSDSM